jgi:hypothetical protein
MVVRYNSRLDVTDDRLAVIAIDAEQCLRRQDGVTSHAATDIWYRIGSMGQNTIPQGLVSL